MVVVSLLVFDRFGQVNLGGLDQRIFLARHADLDVDSRKKLPEARGACEALTSRALTILIRS